LEAKEQTGLNKIEVYSKEGCHLCDRVITGLHKLKNERMFEISIRDITADPELFELYKNMIPVLVINGKVKLAGTMLANPNTLEDILRKAVFSMNMNFEQHTD
jgi:glutaredoxin